MTSIIEQSIAAQKEAKLTEPTTGGFKRELPRAGNALFRLQSYLEVGTVQPKNKTHKASVVAIFTFELLHPDHMITPEGKPAFPQTLTFRVAKSLFHTSRFIRLFKAMNYSGEHEQFDTMIGKESWFGEIFHKKDGDKTYVNLNDEDGVWHIGAPKFTDPMTSVVTDIPVPEMHNEGKLFLWEEAGWSDELIAMAWETLFIETPEDADKSRNWIQETIMKSIDWDASRTKAIVMKEDINLEAMEKSTPSEPAVAPDAPVENDNSALAALGLA